MKKWWSRFKFHIIDFFSTIKQSNFRAPRKVWIGTILVLCGMIKMAMFYHAHQSTNAMLVATIMAVIWLVWYDNELQKRIIVLETPVWIPVEKEKEDERQPEIVSTGWRSDYSNQGIV